MKGYVDESFRALMSVKVGSAEVSSGFFFNCDFPFPNKDLFRFSSSPAVRHVQLHSTVFRTFSVESSSQWIFASSHPPLPNQTHGCSPSGEKKLSVLRLKGVWLPQLGNGVANKILPKSKRKGWCCHGSSLFSFYTQSFRSSSHSDESGETLSTS